MTVRTVETRGKYRLSHYPSDGWVIFRLAPDGSIDVVIDNGKFKDMFPKYMALTGRAINEITPT